MSTVYRILPQHTHRSNGVVKIPLVVGKRDRFEYVPLSEQDAIELALKILQGVKAMAKERA